MNELASPSTKIQPDIDELFERYATTEISEKLLVHNLSVMIKTYTGKISADTNYRPDASLLFEIIKRYALLSSLKIGKEDFFNNISQCNILYNYDSVDDGYLLDKLLASSKDAIINPFWKPLYHIYALSIAFVDDVSACSNQTDDEND